MTARVLVLGPPSSAAIGLMRALDRDGDRCDLIWRGTRWDEMVRTRAARRFLRVSHRTAPDLDAFGAAVLGRATGGDYDVLIPLSDWETRLVAAHAADIGARVAHLTPALAAFDLANDKAATMAHARQIGIATPQVWSWPDAPDLDSLPEDVRFPVVVKARLGAGAGRGVRYAMDRSRLRQAYLDIESSAAVLPTEDFTRPMIMEFIPGFVHDACAVAKGGEVVTVLTQVRQLMNPITGGVGAVTVTTDEPELRDMAGALLESLDWTGPAQVECKYDPRDGQYKLIELNPRLWGTLDTSIRAGMAVPAQIRDLALDRPVRPDRPYQVGLRYVFPSRAAGAYGQLVRAHGLGALRDGRTYAATTCGLDRSDPVPGAWELLSTTAGLARGAVNRLRRRLGGASSLPATGSTPRLAEDLVNTLDRSGDPGF